MDMQELYKEHFADSKKEYHQMHLGLTRRKIRNPQTREQFDQWRTKWITMYKQCNLRIPLDIYVREYEEYYIPVNWIDSKKRQLRTRFRK